MEVIKLRGWVFGDQLPEDFLGVARRLPGGVEDRLIVSGIPGEHDLEVSKRLVDVAVKQKEVSDRPLNRRQVWREKISAAKASFGLSGIGLKLESRTQVEPCLRVVRAEFGGARQMRHGLVGVHLRRVVLVQAAKPELIFRILGIEPGRELEIAKGYLPADAFRQVGLGDPDDRNGHDARGQKQNRELRGFA